MKHENGERNMKMIKKELLKYEVKLENEKLKER
jgi:hypothetical protein